MIAYLTDGEEVNGLPIRIVTWKKPGVILEDKTVRVYTDPLVKDTDGDGLWDGDEAKANLVDLDGIPNIAITDPTDIDTDDDELNDGMEARGWTVGIHWERTMENKETRDVYSNPTVWDTDGDGIKDYFEFINGADPTKEDTDGDLLLDSQEINAEDGTQISNPIGIEGEPPVIGTFEVKVKAKPGILAGWEMTISFDITDNAGLDYVIIDVIGIKKKKITFDKGVVSDTPSITFDVDYARSLFTGYDVVIEAFDDNGNGGRTKRHIDSIFQAAVKFIIGLLMKIAKVIVEIASKAIEWIWGAISKLLDGVLKPIKDGINRWIDQVKNILKEAFDEFEKTELLTETTMEKMFEILS
ncbi:MAG: hypothetical protein AB1779_11400, partial [Candidatus Thermoplasmatota archaeon]